MRTALCFDLDGTITATELLPCIASHLGISSEMATLTRATMEGTISFEESLRLRCLILGMVPAEVVHGIVASVPLNGDIVQFIGARASDCFVVTGNLDVWIGPLVNSLRATLYSSEGTFSEGRLVLNSILDKATAIDDLRTRCGYSRIIAVGDGANDVPMLRNADVAIAFGGVHKPSNAALEESDYVTYCQQALCKLLKGL